MNQPHNQPVFTFFQFLTLIVLITGPLSPIWAQNTIIVDPSGNGDFTTVEGAFNSINNSTLSQQTTIRIKAGTYTDHLVLENIDGTSSSSPLIIESYSGDTSDVLIYHDSVAYFPARHSIELSHVEYVIFRKLTFKQPKKEGNIFSIGESVHNITFEENHIEHDPNRNHNMAAIGLVYDFNITKFEVGPLVIRNNYSHNVALYSDFLTILKLNDLDILDNHIKWDGNPPDLPIFSCNVNISGNIFDGIGIGILSGKGEILVTNNIAKASGIITFSLIDNADTPALVYNNFLISTNSTCAQFSSKHVRFVHNNIYLSDSNRSNDALYLFELDSNEIYNNNIYGAGKNHYGIFYGDTFPATGFKCDYNNFYFPKGNISRLLHGAVYDEYKTLSDHISGIGTDSNSVSVNPLYLDPDSLDLHIRNGALKDKGKFLTWVTKDFDGDNRESGKTDIGADELTQRINLKPVQFISMKGSFYPGKSMEVEYEVENNGGLDLSSIAWRDRLYLSTDTKLDSQDLVLKTITNNFTVKAGTKYIRKQSFSLPYISGGTYYLILRTNLGNQTFDDPTDNLLVSSGMVLPTPQLPDLQVDSIRIPSTLYSGKNFSLQWTVTNTGSANTSGSWSDYVYVATSPSALNNPALASSDSLLKYKVIAPSGLNMNQSYTSSVTVHIPIKFSGNVYYRIQTNGDHSIFEQDTSFADNGLVSDPLNIVQSPLPDLTVTDLNIPTTTFSGDTVSVNWTVTNVGKQKTYRTDRYYDASPLSDHVEMWYDRLVITKNKYYLPDDDANETKARYYRPQNDELDVDSSYRVDTKINFDRCEYGKYYVFVETNYRQTTFELRYDNNVELVDSIEVVLQPNPDLLPKVLQFTGSPASGKEASVKFTIKNDGFADKEGIYHTDQLYLHSQQDLVYSRARYLGSYVGSDTLKKGDSYTETKNYRIPYDIYGNYYLSLVTDRGNKVCEAPNEDNNILTIGPVNIDLSPVPDIRVEAVKFPDTVAAGETFEMIIRTYNDGAAAVEESYFGEKVLLSGGILYQLGRFTKPAGLAANGEYLDTFTYTIPLETGAGKYNFTILADYSNRVFEHSGETNNTYTSPEIVVTRNMNNVPDLEVKNIQLVSSNITAGDIIELDVTLVNNSKSTNESGWKDWIQWIDENGRIYSNDILNHLGRIERNQELQKRVRVQVPYEISGTFTLEYYTNHDMKPLEYIISNNSKEIQLNISPYIPPDLEPVDINPISCCRIYALQFDTLDVKIMNNGPGVLYATEYQTHVYLSDDEILDKRDHRLASWRTGGAINKNSSRTVRIPVKYPSYLSGEYFYIVEVDAEDDIYEASAEDNNRYTSGYSVTLSNETTDLSLDSVGISDYTGSSDRYVYVDYKFSKPKADSIYRFRYNQVVLSKDRTFGPTSVSAANVQRTNVLKAGDSSYTDRQIASIPSDLEPGYYFIGMWLDSRNEILESNEANNVMFSKDSFFFDFSVPLVLDVKKDTQFYEGMFANRSFYRVERPADYGMIVDLEVSNKNASTEMYQKADGIPSSADYDNKYNNPYLADQQIIVPVTDTNVTDYIKVDPTYMPPIYTIGDPENRIIDPIPYSIIAQSAEFSVYSVFPENGSVLGLTSVTVTGFDFDTTTEFYFSNSTDTIYPTQSTVINSSIVALLMDLRDHTVDKYTVYAVKNGKTVKLDNGFEVQGDGFPDPWVNIDITSRELTRNNTTMNVNFGNYGNSNGYDYWLVIAMSSSRQSTEYLHTSYVGSSEEEMYERFENHPNPPGDSTHIDVDGIRYFIYWLPMLAAKTQTTFTYIINHSEVDTVGIQAMLFRQPLSTYTLTGNPADIGLSTTAYEVYQNLSEHVNTMNKAGIDCDDIDINNVQKQLVQQTLQVAKNVHAGAKPFAGANGIQDVYARGMNNWRKNVTSAFDLKGNAKTEAKAAFKEIVLKKTPIKDAATGFIDRWNPIKRLTGTLTPSDPPFKDLVNGVFSCIGSDENLKNSVNGCIICIRDDSYDKGAKRCYNNCKNKPRPKNLKEKLVSWVKSFDPNEIEGPDGFTEMRFVNNDDVMPYTIRFENKSEAGAPAVEVRIDNPLDSNFRLQSFRLTEIGFGDTVIMLNGENALNKIINLGPKYNGLKLHIVAGIDPVNHRAFWRLTSIDPITGNPVEDPFSGFLPPNDSTGIGEGYVRYEIELKPNLDAGTYIRNAADIYFDQNELIPTNIWTNIVVTGDPYSQVAPLPSHSPETFTVEWNGSDGDLGPGILGYSVFVSKNGKPYEEWISYTTDTSAEFTGQMDSSYSFYSVLHMNNGESELAPSSPDAETTIESSSVITINSNQEIVIYPNPGSDHLTVEGKFEGESAIVRIINLSGQEVMSTAITGDRTKLDVSSLTGGFYFVEIATERYRSTMRWIKD